MSLSHFDPLANFRVFEDSFARLLSEPAGEPAVVAGRRYLRNRERAGP